MIRTETSPVTTITTTVGGFEIIVTRDDGPITAADVQALRDVVTAVRNLTPEVEATDAPTTRKEFAR